MKMIDIVTVYHREKNRRQAEELEQALSHYENPDVFSFYAHDNRENNVGFAKACNIGALRPGANASIIGFLNPDVVIRGKFIARVLSTLVPENVVITGCRYGKKDRELKIWGVKDWVCGAALFVKRSWFEEVGGFDERFFWSHEETDLIRRAEAQKLKVVSRNLPIQHKSPTDDDPSEAAFKAKLFSEAQQAYIEKWAR